MKKYRNDIILAGAVLAVAAVFFFIYMVWGERGAVAEVSVDGEEYGKYSLRESREVEISTPKGENKLVIENGYVCVKEADCPDKICVRQGKISRQGQTIICLPHNLVVTITGGEDEDVDATAGK